MRKIRVAIIGPNTFPIPAIRGGAIESGVTNIINLNEFEQRLDITVFTVKDKDLVNVTKNYKYTKFIQIDKSYWLLPHIFIFKIFNRLFHYPWNPKSAYMHRINKYLEKEQYDVIQFSTGSVEVASLSNKVKSKIKYVVASDYLNKQTPGIGNIISRVDMFASNEYIIDRIVSILGVKKENTFITTATTNISLPSKEQIQLIKKQIRQKHNISFDEIVVIYVGRLSPEKGALELVKAIKKTKNCKLIIVGGPNFNSNQQTDYIKDIKREVEDSSERVIFTGYLQNHDEVSKYMLSADIACVPSICNEAGSIALLEFRAAGLPVIASDKGGMKYHSGENTIFVRCDDKYVDRLAVEIQKLVDDPVYRMELSSKARIGIEKHSQDRAYNIFFDTIIRLINP